MEDLGVEYAVTLEGARVVAGRCFVGVIAGRRLDVIWKEVVTAVDG